MDIYAPKETRKTARDLRGGRPAFFLPFQKRWIEDRSRLKLWEKARQLGASWTDAFRQAWETGKVGNRLDVWVSSRDETQAKLYAQDCRRFAKILDTASRKRMRARILADVRSESPQQIVFANERTVTALGSLPDAQAGKRGHRVLDEFALNRDPKRLYGIANPGAMWGGSISIISTHRGSGNYFNELVREVREGENPKKISLHRTTLTTALEEGFLARLQSKIPDDDPRKEMDLADFYDYTRDSCPDEETFLEEFECVPADDASAFLPYTLITPAEYAEDFTWEASFADLKKRNNPLYLGLDIGRSEKGDLTCFWLLEKVGEIYETVLMIVFRGEPFAGQKATLDNILSLPNVRRACIDRSGIGRQLAEEARKKHGNRVEEVNFTLESKAEMAYPLRSLFESQRIRIPNERTIRADLHSVRKIYTDSGNVRFAGDKGVNGHADRFWALALAVHGTEKVNHFFAKVIG